MKNWHAYGLAVGIAAFLGGVSYSQLPAEDVLQCGGTEILITGLANPLQPVFANLDGYRLELGAMEKEHSVTTLRFTDLDGVELLRVRTKGKSAMAAITRHNDIQVEQCEGL